MLFILLVSPHDNLTRSHILMSSPHLSLGFLMFTTTSNICYLSINNDLLYQVLCAFPQMQNDMSKVYID